MSHTPGPWQIGQKHSHGAKVTNGHVTVAWCGANGTYSKDYAYVIDGGEAAANAALIAAAPDLLEALEAFVTDVDMDVIRARPSDMESLVRTLTKANAAIAKARGEK